MLHFQHFKKDISGIQVPDKFTFPFYYEPHPLTLVATKELQEYLEKQFKSGMTWKNHSLKGWHIDHIIPLNSAKTPEVVEKLMHYTNLQPMWATYNLKKGNKII